MLRLFISYWKPKMIYGHGDDIYDRKEQIKSNFSSNVFYGDNSHWLEKFLQERWNVLHSYPEPNASSFVTKIEAKYKLPANTICATHGATDAIYLVAQAFRGSKSAILIPTFAEYEDACTVNQHKLFFIQNLDKISRTYDLVWLCNPNNPTGASHDYQKLLQLSDRHPKTIFVIDQTYRYFTPKRTLSYLDAIQRPNVILIDSFTKRFALPDLRLGYFVANADVLRRIVYYKQPWAVSQLAIEVGKYVMETAPYPLDLGALLEETRRLQQELGKIETIEVQGTHTHFFLCRLKKGKAANLKKHLLQNHGILIRNAANFRGLNDSYFRIATQQRAENDQLVAALKTYFETNKQ